MSRWVIVYGGLGDGLQGVVGPFNTEEQAETYAETYNLGHYEKIIYQLETPENCKTLRQVSPNQLLDAAINFYSKSCPDVDVDKWMKLGFKLGQPGGEEEVAPAWIEDLIDVKKEEDT